MTTPTPGNSHKETRRAFVDSKSREYITQQEAAAILGCTDRTIRNHIATGRLIAYRLGPRMIRLRLDEVEATLKPFGGGLYV